MSEVLPNYEEFVEGKFTEARVLAIKKMFKKHMIKVKKVKGSTEPDKMATTDIGILFRKLNFNPTNSEIIEMMRAIDPNKEGAITFYQFLYILWMKTMSGEEEDVLSSFKINIFFKKLFDTDGDGIIAVDDLKRLLTKVGEPFDEEEMKAFALHADSNENGLIDYEDFVNRMNIEESEEKTKETKEITDTEEAEEPNEE